MISTTLISLSCDITGHGRFSGIFGDTKVIRRKMNGLTDVQITEFENLLKNNHGSTSLDFLRSLQPFIEPQCDRSKVFIVRYKEADKKSLLGVAGDGIAGRNLSRRVADTPCWPNIGYVRAKEDETTMRKVIEAAFTTKNDPIELRSGSGLLLQFDPEQQLRSYDVTKRTFRKGQFTRNVQYKELSTSENKVHVVGWGQDVVEDYLPQQLQNPLAGFDDLRAALNETFRRIEQQQLNALVGHPVPTTIVSRQFRGYLVKMEADVASVRFIDNNIVHVYDLPNVDFDQNFGLFGKLEKNENLMLEKLIDKDFYNDFGDLYDPEAGAPES